MDGWHELADGVLVRRYDELDLSVGLVLGSERALVIDTRGDHTQGVELADAVRVVTPLPWDIVITHGHFDHCFGTKAFLPAPVWAHERCAAHVERTTELQRDAWMRQYRDENRADTAEALAATEVIPPDHPVVECTLALGDRSARLLHLGAGHTDHDLVIEVPDAAVVFAGDLVENGAPPDFEDAHPLQWPSTLDQLLQLRPNVVVPGHGDPVGPEFVRAQRAELAILAGLCRAVDQDSITSQEAVERSPYPAATTRAALNR